MTRHTRRRGTGRRDSAGCAALITFALLAGTVLLILGIAYEVAGR